MWRPNSFVRNICIIFLLINCSASTEHTKFIETTLNRPISDVPTISLYIINGNKNDTRSSSTVQHEDTVNSVHNKNIDESSHQNAVDLMLVPKLAVEYRKNRYENSKTRSIGESHRYKRQAEAQDLCKTGECKCKLETKFLTVDCNFQQVSNLFSILFSVILFFFFLFYIQ